MFRHIGIVVNNIDKMLWFYRDILGLEVMYDKIEEGKFLNHILNTNNESPRIIKLGLNGKTIVELLYFNRCKEEPKKSLVNNGYTHFAITVGDCEKLFTSFIDNNISVINTPIQSTDNNVKVFFGVDPENNIIEFVELI